MSSPGFSAQLDTLISRQISILFGSFSNFLLLLCQPPLIGLFIGLGWSGDQPEKATWFSMIIAAVWLGCMNSCCAIVRERAVYERERMFNINIFAYVLSKLSVLSVISLIQMAILYYATSRNVLLPTDITRVSTIFIMLSATAIASTGLGLLISSYAKTAYGAVMTVPILLIPQVIFSELMLQRHIDKKIPSIITDYTITKWGYDALTSLGKSLDSIEWGNVAFCLVILMVQLFAFTILTTVKLKLDDN